MKELSLSELKKVDGGANARCFFFGALSCLGSLTSLPGSTGFIPLCTACSNT